VPVTGPDGVVRNTQLNGNAGANILVGPGIKNVDVGLHKEFGLWEGTRLQLRIESFNVFNTPNFIAPQKFTNNVSGATLTNVRDPRSIQIALKALF
jgi:hypothetical protein